MGTKSTYGLGMIDNSSNADASGVWARVAGLYGRKPPVGVSGRPERWSLKFLPGAKSITFMKASSFNMCGVGRTCRGDGGGIGLRGARGPGTRPEAEENARGPDATPFHPPELVAI